MSVVKKIAHPALVFYQQVEKRYPSLWSTADEFRQKMFGTQIVHKEGSIVSKAEATAVAFKIEKSGTLAFSPIALGALIAWRPSKGIYRFHPALYEAVIETEISGDIPSHLLTRLPSYAVFIDSPGLVFCGNPISGFWAYLSRMGKQESIEIVGLYTDGDAHGLTIPLGNHPVSDLAAMSLAATFEDSEIEYKPTDEEWSELKGCLSAMFSLMLYLCSEKPDIDQWQPPVPQLKYFGTKRRMMQAKEPKQWDVGLRLGAAFDLAEKSQSGGSGNGSSSVRPHIRRAHWHSFWIGKRGEQTISLRWLPPIPVNVEDLEALPAVIHPVLTTNFNHGGC